MKTKYTTNQSGFTIIEITVVLLIAGMVLAMVLLLIPNLQRNSRNNQRKQDVNAILEAVSHWELGHSGTVPVQSDPYLDYAKLSYYDRTTGVTIQPLLAGAAAPALPADLDIVRVYNHQKCSPTDPAASTFVGAGYNDVVAIYAIEGGGGAVNGQCLEIS